MPTRRRQRQQQEQTDHTKRNAAGAVAAGAAAGGAVGSRAKVLSPVKLYKHDQKNKRVARTFGPKGKPYQGCSGSICYRHENVDWAVHRLAPTLHERGGPRRKAAVQGVLGKLGPNSKIIKGDKKKAKKLGKRLDKIDDKLKKTQPKTNTGRRAHKIANKGLDKAYNVHDTIKHGAKSVEFSKDARKDTAGFLRKTSPRWGEGKVPGRMEGRKVVGTPKGKHIEISKKSYVAAGAVAGGAAYGAHKYRQHKKAQAAGITNPSNAKTGRRSTRPTATKRYGRVGRR